MEISKKKAFIYVLTFLTYAWSGYGSDVISNLRDAVLSAEKVFGNFLENAMTVVKNFRSVKDVLEAAVEESCEFRCPSGAPPVKNKFHKPSSDGCGSYGVELNTYLKKSEVKACCDGHDMCYDTCNSRKETCDFELQRCLYKLCSTNTEMSEEAKLGCKTTAKMFFASTFALGCKAYLDSQKKACYCKGSGKSKYTDGAEL